MITFQRHLVRKYMKQVRSFTGSSVLSSKKDKKEEDKHVLTKEEATNKLNDLLQFMIKNEDGDKPKKEVQLAQAVKRVKPVKPVKEKPLGEKLAGAAKDVATSLGGDVKKTESELLNILTRQSEGTQILRDVLKGIKVEKSQETSRAQQVRSSLARSESEKTIGIDRVVRDQRKPKKKSGTHVDILGAQPSEYFKGLQPQPAPCELQTWNGCVDRDLRLAVTHPPCNIYEQMILWTDRGMFWHFPINNEQGLEEEKKVSFEEHIFLEEHLEGWCPDKGPIRHFMELVCVGLSKNHWLTVQEKKNHIMWYRDYFAEKSTLVQEVGAGIIAVEPGEQKEASQ